MRLVSFDDVPLLDQAAPTPLDHIGADGQISVHAQHPAPHVVGGGHVQGQAEAAGVQRGGVAGGVREVERVVAGGQTLRLQQRLGLRQQAGPWWHQASLPALTVGRGQGQGVVPGGAAAAHRPQAQAGRPTLRPRRIVIPCQSLRADRTGAQFQHGGKRGRDLSIVLHKTERNELY